MFGGSSARDYIYQGEVKIHQQDLDRFLAIAQRLKLEGLIGGEQQEEEKDDNYMEEEMLVPENYSSQNINRNETKIIRNVRTAEKPVISIQSSDIHNMEELDQKVEESYSKDSTGNYACHYCTRSFKERSHMKEHVEIHFDGLSFPCNFCEKTLRSRSALRMHKQRNHS